MIVVGQNLPVLVLAFLRLRTPILATTDLDHYRIALITLIATSLLMHMAGAYLLVRVLGPSLAGRQSLRDILHGFRGQALICAGITTVLWSISIGVREQIETLGGSLKLSGPLITYSWVGLALVLVLGSLTMVVVSTRTVSVPEAQVL